MDRLDLAEDFAAYVFEMYRLRVEIRSILHQGGFVTYSTKKHTKVELSKYLVIFFHQFVTASYEYLCSTTMLNNEIYCF